MWLSFEIQHCICQSFRFHDLRHCEWQDSAIPVLSDSLFSLLALWTLSHGHFGLASERCTMTRDPNGRSRHQLSGYWQTRKIFSPMCSPSLNDRSADYEHYSFLELAVGYMINPKNLHLDSPYLNPPALSQS